MVHYQRKVPVTKLGLDQLGIPWLPKRVMTSRMVGVPDLAYSISLPICTYLVVVPVIEWNEHPLVALKHSTRIFNRHQSATVIINYRNPETKAKSATTSTTADPNATSLPPSKSRRPEHDDYSDIADPDTDRIRICCQEDRELDDFQPSKFHRPNDTATTLHLKTLFRPFLSCSRVLQ